MPSFKQIVALPAVQSAVATAGAWYLRLVWYSSRVAFEPTDIYDTAHTPVIVAMWHGQHFLMPFVKKNDGSHRAKVLISRHRDGEINARAAEKFGIQAIRGSGDHGGEFYRKGGAAAFSKMLDALAQGYNVAMTADIPKIARVAGLGAIKLAQRSGRPIYAVAVASSRRIELDNWDHTAVNLPFSRIGVAASEPIYVPSDADSATLESARQHIESELNRLTARAYMMADHERGTKP